MNIDINQMLGLNRDPAELALASQKINEARMGLDESYLQMAEVRALRSYATRTRVGALLVKDQQILADGYNGMPRGMPNALIEFVDDAGNLHTNPLVIHAEANVFDKVAKNGSEGVAGATLYVTLSPCLECAKRIINTGVARVVYRDLYRISDSLEVLRRAGVDLVHLPKELT